MQEDPSAKKPTGIHAWARDILTKAFLRVMGRQPTLGEIQGAQVVAWKETQYGRGWKDQGDPRSIGSNNWGAVQCCKPDPNGRCPSGSFLYTDTHPQKDGSAVKYNICFKVYPGPDAGAEDIIRILFKSKKYGDAIQQAGSSGSLSDFSRTMYNMGYYEGWGPDKDTRIKNHIKYLGGGLDTITKALNEEVALKPTSSPTEQLGVPGQMPGTMPVNDTFESLREYEDLMQQLVASGPISKIVRQAVERSVLPTTRVLLAVDSKTPLYMQIRYAHILSSALRSELGAEVSLHCNGKKVELECDVTGSEKIVLGAVAGLSEGVSNAFDLATKGRKVLASPYIGLDSSYPILDSQTSEDNFRKFAFELMEI